MQAANSDTWVTPRVVKRDKDYFLHLVAFSALAGALAGAFFFGVLV